MSARRQEGRHYAITGASSGIGRATAVRLGSEGARLSLFSRRVEKLEETARLATEAGATGTFVQACDVVDKASIDAAFDAGAEALGPMWGVVANAGVANMNFPGPNDAFEDILNINLVGAYYTTRAGIRHLAESSEARHVVVMSSLLSRIGGPGITAYCASKAGLLGMVRALAHEMGRFEVQVNAICPGYVDTDMGATAMQMFGRNVDGDLQAKIKAVYKGVPIRRMSAPEDIAGVVAWLVSPDSRGVTGQAIDVNNGMWMG
ncbi:MAG: SDR family oxidoreductase [Proteobacteria bacterium]|nr:SDR family oxidoreductase [Pseudomonadota bacterium]